MSTQVGGIKLDSTEDIWEAMVDGGIGIAVTAHNGDEPGPLAQSNAGDAASTSGSVGQDSGVGTGCGLHGRPGFRSHGVLSLLSLLGLGLVDPGALNALAPQPIRGCLLRKRDTAAFDIIFFATRAARE